MEHIAADVSGYWTQASVWIRRSIGRRARGSRDRHLDARRCVPRTNPEGWRTGRRSSRALLWSESHRRRPKVTKGSRVRLRRIRGAPSPVRSAILGADDCRAGRIAYQARGPRPAPPPAVLRILDRQPDRRNSAARSINGLVRAPPARLLVKALTARLRHCSGAGRRRNATTRRAAQDILGTAAKVRWSSWLSRMRSTAEGGAGVSRRP